MPYYLVIILTPKIVYLNQKNDVIIKRSLARQEDTELVVDSSQTTIPAMRSRASSRAEPPMPTAVAAPANSDKNAPKSASSEKQALEFLHGELFPDNDDTELAEINVRSYVLQELESMFEEHLVSARPTLVDDETGNSVQAMCICEKESIDEVIARLAFFGVGNLVGSINVLSLESTKFYRPPKPEPSTTKEGQELPPASVNSTGAEAPLSPAAAAQEAELAEQVQKKKRMVMEAASQIRVEQVVESIKESSILNFDYVSLLLIASVIAGVGLATNSVVAIVASMLVSPIMGPVLACTFGTIVHKWSLVRLGVYVELLSLLICCVVGFCVGLITMAIGTGGSWPTPEMHSRGLLDGLLTGLAIAIPSGMGVALSILGNNTSSLVGVAISASLLPPAVNCGMCLAYAAAGFTIDPNAVTDGDGEYTTSRSFADIGGISLALVIVNIGAIYVAGYVMFRLKEVAPIQNKPAFWQRDTHVFRQLMMQPNNPAGQAPEIDLEAQVSILKEIGHNRELRQQLMVESDDVLLSLASGNRAGVGSVPSLLSASSTIRMNKPKYAPPGVNVALDKNSDGSTLRSPNAKENTDSSPKRSPRKQTEARSTALLDLFRRDDALSPAVRSETSSPEMRTRPPTVPASAVAAATSTSNATAATATGGGVVHVRSGSAPPRNSVAMNRAMSHASIMDDPPGSAGAVFDLNEVKNRLRRDRRARSVHLR